MRLFFAESGELDVSRELSEDKELRRQRETTYHLVEIVGKMDCPETLTVATDDMKGTAVRRNFRRNNPWCVVGEINQMYILFFEKKKPYTAVPSRFPSKPTTVIGSFYPRQKTQHFGLNAHKTVMIMT